LGRATESEDDLTDHPLLPFASSEIPLVDSARINNRKGLNCPLWTENKAKLIQEYIKLFTFVTKHGTYIDGFAAPQRRNHSAKCSAKLVLENQPQWVRDFWLCDIDPGGIALLEAIKSEHEGKNRRIHVLPGDFNASIAAILASGTITDKTATFALLDQRTFECDWATVQRIASHKTTTKIEIFYFFATGWIDRSIAAIRNPDAQRQAERWWGRPDWRELRGMNGVERANLLAARFRDELGYRWAFPFAIHDAARGGRTMYHMVHATDHPEASPLMLRAYRKVSGRPDWDRPALQSDLGNFWNEVV
jgi:three-Cys-motif partner protein